MGFEVLPSAGKHGVEREDVLHALTHYYFRMLSFDEPRREGASRPDLYIGPPRQLGGPMLEVMVETIPPCTIVVFHAMVARQKFLKLMEE